MKKGIVFLSALFLGAIGINVSSREPLTFQERVKAQEAIERVYYSHRIWPKENPEPKPPFEKMVSKEVIEAKVNDYLKKCSALDQFWQRPIIASQLQAEMDRMAKGTKDPATLNELFKALNDDPYLIAECLARPVLADRLIHNWYANDERFHKEARAKAEEAAKVLTPENFCSYPEGQYFVITFKLEIEGREEMENPDPEDRSIKLSKNEFEKMMAEIPEESMISRIDEKNECFLIVHTIKKEEGRMEVESLIFRKKGVDEWLKSLAIPSNMPENGSPDLYLPPMFEEECVGGWENEYLEDIPYLRKEHTAVWTGTEMIVWGGHNGGYMKSGHRYNPGTDTWVDMSIGENCPSERNDHTAVWTGTEMIIWGGRNSGNLNTGGRYNPSTDSWSPTSTGVDCPTGRIGNTAIWTGKEMIVWGGFDGSNYLKSGGRYNPATDTWVATSTGGSCPSARAWHTSVWTGTEMIVWGGFYDYTYLQTGGRYFPETDIWTTISTGTGCPIGRASHSAVWTDSEMIIWGGNTASFTYTKTGGRYNPSTDSWTETSTATGCPSMRDSHAAAWTGSRMIIWGGGYRDDYGNEYFTNTGGLYNPWTDSWAATSTGANCPAARNGNTAVWTGTEMIVWGGYNEEGYLLAGGRYSPSSDTWVPTMPEDGNPSPRIYHTAVWTGSEMIIWGGYATNNYLNSGGCYNASTDSWRATSTGMNCPSARQYHTAVWTGSEMIVWGGYYCLNSGGGYNPLTDSWTATSAVTNCPVGRYWHTAVWTGTEMIVWGGQTSSGSTKTGGRYAPATDTWTTMISGPSSRIHHTAVWTGTEMIIWGGNSTSWLNSGGRYKPSSDTWVSTSTGTNCPTGRRWHTAVWADPEMIVWGGQDSSFSYNNDGGRYNPSTNTWKGISVSPAGRYYHTAVWTGGNMIVWGGTSGSNVYTNTGGCYYPSSDSWEETPTGQNCPSERRYHTSVWTGSEMIVWGGFNLVYTPDGRIYFPAADVYGPFFGCEGIPVTLTTGSYSSYQWLKDGEEIDGATSQNYVAAENGNYSVRVIARNDCSMESDAHLLTFYTPPIPSVTGSSSGCSSSGVVLSTGTYSAYQWIKDNIDVSGATSRTFTVTESGSYAVRVVDDHGCSGASAAQEVTILISPSPSISGSSSGCGIVHLSTGSFSSYQWNRNHVPITGATSREYDVTESGTYSVLVTESNGCEGVSADTYITVYPLPVPSITGNADGCFLTGVALGTDVFTTYQWNYEGVPIPGAMSRNYQAMESGNYSVTATNVLGCVGTSSAHNVTIYSIPPVVSGDSSACTGSVVTLSTTTYPSYQWYKDGALIDGATGQTLDVTGSGTYTVFVDVPEGGCSGTSEGFVVQFADPPANPPVITGASSNSCPATSVTLQTTEAFGSYQWYHNGNLIPGATGQSFDATLSGNYTVSAGAIPGCQLTSSAHIVSIGFCLPSEVSPNQAVYPANIWKDSESDTGYYLYFQKINGVDGYNIYEGTMGSWYSHSGQPGNVCAATVTDLGTGEMRAEISPSAGDHYYLVTAYSDAVEGPSGFNSANTEIDPLLSSCSP